MIQALTSTEQEKESMAETHAIITLLFPDGKKAEYPTGITGAAIAQSISEGLHRKALGLKLNDTTLDLSAPLHESGSIKILTFVDKEGQDIFRHSSAHLMAQAITRLFPAAKLTIGPVVEEGFYYDIDHPPFKNDDLEKIEAEMKKIVKEDLPIERKELSLAQALELFRDNPYKKEIIQDIGALGETGAGQAEQVSVYRQGEFADLCRGPHLPRTGLIKAFKLIKLAGAYWRADAKNKQLQRIYGISFPEKKELEAHLTFLEEVKKRDHKILGRELDLFDTCEEIGPGLIMWLPKGNIIKEELENWAKETEQKWGYQRVTTPLLTKEGLFYQSEHLPHYADSMYAPMIIENERYYIKPMNCPFHHMVFKARPRSYRDLPLRLAEYGWCHRYEDSGALFGLMRVRGMQMNDAHIYCTKDQAVEEFIAVIRLHEYYYHILGITDYWMELCLRDPKSDKYHGDEAMWREAEDLMRLAMEKSGVKYTVVIGGAAFYGPKIDFQIKSAIGKTFTASTNQIDLFMPMKFNLKYIGTDGNEHVPVVLHRAPLGTHERFIGFLIEHFAGKFPLWLNPVQVKVLPIADRHIPYAETILTQLQTHDIRGEINTRAETISKKVREAQLERVNYILIVGDKEVEAGTVNVRTRDNVVHGERNMAEFITDLGQEIKQKKIGGAA
jgi:threonyl-tRNA synthetase